MEFDNGAASGLLAGLLFGLALEGAGFASARKLTAQFSFRDWAVFKVMFTAIVTAAAGLWLLDATGVMPLSSVYSPTLYAWPMAVGGVLIGIGFAVGGYCPGTSAVGAFSGRIDGLVFALGMMFGITAFAGSWDSVAGFLVAGQGEAGQSLADLTGLPAWVVIVALAALAGAGFALARRVEPRMGGVLTVEDVLEDGKAAKRR